MTTADMTAELARFEFRGMRIPEHMRDGLARYLSEHIAPGSFLTAVLSNNLADGAPLLRRRHVEHVDPARVRRGPPALRLGGSGLGQPAGRAAVDRPTRNRTKGMTYELLVYTVYCRPSDFPDSFVVRRSRPLDGKVEHERDLWCLARTLEGARASIPQELHRLDRHPSDDPVIVETWL